MILAARSFPQLRATFDEYVKVCMFKYSIYAIYIFAIMALWLSTLVQPCLENFLLVKYKNICVYGDPVYLIRYMVGCERIVIIDVTVILSEE